MGQQRKPKFRQTRLQFTKPDTNHPSSLPSQAPLKPLPRPTAPPLFQEPTPKKKRRTDSYAFDDEYWEMGQRLIDGEPLNPAKKIVEEGAPVINVDDSDSDDDFEPPGLFSQVARQRPHLLTPTSRLRNDRSSMTKSSANRRRKTKKPICFTTPPQKRTSTPAVCAKKRSAPALESSSSEEEIDHVVFEGEKSELSETDEDEPVPITSRERPKNDTCRNFTYSDVPHESVRCEHKSAAQGGRNALKSPKSSALNTIGQTNRMSTISKARVNDFPKPGDAFEGLQGTKSKSTPIRARDLPPLFFDDSDDSIEAPILTSSERKRTRRIRRIRESSDEDIQQDAEQVSLKHKQSHSGAERTPQEDSRAVEIVPAIILENESQSGQENEPRIIDSDRQIKGTKSKRKRLYRSNSLLGRTERPVCEEPIHPSKDLTRSPLRSKTRRRLSFLASEDAEITPSPSPSPPSTRKRRLRPKLITVSSEEENEPRRDSPKRLGRPDKAQKSVGLGGALEENEWYHERDIDTFSSSAEDGNEPKENSSSGRVVAVRSKKRVSATKPGTQTGLLTKLSADPKDPVLDVSEAFVNDDTFREHDDRTERPDKTTNVDRISNEVIDLIDDDDFEVVALSSTQKDNIMSSVEDDGKGLANLNDLPSYEIDDSKPPPFNLYILCNEGESIADMRERLGENELMDKVMQARNAGREIIGGDKIGLTATFDKDIFSRFSKTVVGDQVSREKKSTSITEKALRGEYNFSYRGKDRDQRRRGNLSHQRGSARTGRGKSYRNRLSNLGRRRQ